jgi:hypothetical protein
MKYAAIITLGLCLGAGGALAGDKHDHAHDRRELGAHQHGHGTLAIAIEAGTVAMELRAPGADIAGFEHAAKTDADRKAIDTAKQKLAAALDLFTPPAAARCTLASANVALEGETGGHDHEKKAAEKPDHDAAAHSEFHATYELACAAPENLTTITFNYFKAFANTRALDVQVIGPGGQRRFEVKPAKPVIDLSGII